jgi:4-amino-4-deoxy-L-arabinose transferase-like glycosyltransferase
MWFDELFMFYISRLSIHDIWTILSSGIEPNPPLSYLLTHFSMQLFGQNEISVRLPEILGYWLMSICIFFFVRRHASFSRAAVAMLFPISTQAYLEYATEARAYGLVLGFAALAALCWQRVSVPGQRALALIGLAGALLAANISHYYSVLLLVPFGIGELVRWWKLRKVDVPVVLALAASLLPLVVLYPAVKRGSVFITHLVRASSNFWAAPTLSKVPLFYMEFLDGALAPLVFSAVVIVLLYAWRPQEDVADRKSDVRLPLHEVVMTAALVALPVYALVLGKVFTGSFIFRYAISAVVGCSLSFGLLLARRGESKSFTPYVLLVAFLGWFLVNGIHNPRARPVQSVPGIRLLDAQSPIAVSDPLVFLQMFHYAPPDLVRRMHFVSDMNTVAKMPDFVPELALNVLKDWFHLPVEDYKQFVASHHHGLLQFRANS